MMLAAFDFDFVQHPRDDGAMQYAALRADAGFDPIKEVIEKKIVMIDDDLLGLVEGEGEIP
jgi:exonuclease I